jgi:hypothetical protein
LVISENILGFQYLYFEHNLSKIFLKSSTIFLNHMHSKYNLNINLDGRIAPVVTNNPNLFRDFLTENIPQIVDGYNLIYYYSM